MRYLGKIFIRKDNQVYWLTCVNNDTIKFIPDNQDSNNNQSYEWYFLGRNYYKTLEFLICDKDGHILYYDNGLNFKGVGQPVTLKFHPEFSIVINGQKVDNVGFTSDRPPHLMFDQIEIPSSSPSFSWLIWIIAFTFLFIAILILIIALIEAFQVHDVAAIYPNNGISPQQPIMI